MKVSAVCSQCVTRVQRPLLRHCISTAGSVLIERWRVYARRCWDVDGQAVLFQYFILNFVYMLYKDFDFFTLWVICFYFGLLSADNSGSVISLRCLSVLVLDLRLISVRPFCSVGQEAGQEVESAGGLKQGNAHTSPTGRTDRSQEEEIEEVEGVCCFRCRVSKLESCQTKACGAAALCFLSPDFRTKFTFNMLEIFTWVQGRRTFSPDSNISESTGWSSVTVDRQSWFPEGEPWWLWWSWLFL